MTDKLQLMGMGRRAQIASTRKNKRYFHNSFRKSKCIIQNYELHATKKRSHQMDKFTEKQTQKEAGNLNTSLLK